MKTGYIIGWKHPDDSGIETPIKPKVFADYIECRKAAKESQKDENKFEAERCGSDKDLSGAMHTYIGYIDEDEEIEWIKEIDEHLKVRDYNEND